MSKISQKIFFVLGGPGSGKGTFCQLFVENNKMTSHYSAGELLRKFMYKNKNNPNSKIKKMYNTVQRSIDQGQIVPAQITIQLLQDEIQNDSNSLLLIDGFPRNQGNYMVWEKQNLKPKNNYAIFLNCKNESLYKRMLNRQQNSTVQRSDDTEDIFQLRLKTFQNETIPIIEKYKQKDQLIELNAEQDPLKIVKDFQEIYLKIFSPSIQINNFHSYQQRYKKYLFATRLNHLKKNVKNFKLLSILKQSINQNIKELMINNASSAPRKRFYSENLTSPMFCFLDKHKIQQPLTPQIEPLKLDQAFLDELEELNLEPSEEFEQEKAEISTYLSTNDESVLQKIKPKAFLKNEFEFSFDIDQQQICQTSQKSCNQSQDQQQFLALHKNSLNQQINSQQFVIDFYKF